MGTLMAEISQAQRRYED